MDGTRHWRGYGCRQSGSPAFPTKKETQQKGFATSAVGALHAFCDNWSSVIGMGFCFSTGLSQCNDGLVF